ncbi:MAG: putative cytosol aminopeptidase [Candidatus Binatia bacterium]|nr:MAG: putative cytosol aminopeptidase [Candidatus Binatia bacterium]
MRVTTTQVNVEKLAVDLLVVPTTADWKAGTVAELDKHLHGALVPEVRQQGFKGQDNEQAIFQTHGHLPYRHILLVGLGTGDSPSVWYRVAQVAASRAQELQATHVGFVPLPAYADAPTLERVAEGWILSLYRFDELKSTNGQAAKTTHPRLVVVAKGTAELKAALRRAEHLALAACYARDLVNRPAAIVTPAYLAQEAKRIAREHDLSGRVFDVTALRRARMQCILGVAQGSEQPPRFIELVYRPAKAKRVIALAGKGITFDSGGLNLKTGDGMTTMKRDMAGAAVVLAVMSAVRSLDVNVEVRGYVAAAENMPSGRALRPGDVLTARNGKTIEVLNTDAEGRLVLADALSYAAEGKPDVLIDFATLTGAVRTALGTRYAAIMGTNRQLVADLIAAGQASGENLWELPLVEEYRSELQSSVADLKNIGEGGAGTIIGGLFLREFTGNIPWAHIDFSSTASTDKPFACHPRGATGFGVRTVLRYLLAQGS